MMEKTRLHFWQWAHQQAEDLQEWIYFSRMKPLMPKITGGTVTAVEELFPGRFSVKITDGTVTRVEVRSSGSSYN